MCAFVSAEQKQVTWVVVTNGKRMRVYDGRQVDKIVSMGGTSKHPYQVEKKDWELTSVPGMDVDVESIKDYQMGHDHRGSIFGFDAGERHTVEPHIDIRDEIRDHLMRHIAARLQEAQKSQQFDRLILIAPGTMLGELKTLLGPLVAKIIVAEIPKDLTLYKNRELVDRIKDALPVKQGPMRGG